MSYQQMIFINLVVNDLSVTKKFFTDLGFRLNEQFSDEETASVVISDTIITMLHTRERFAQYTPAGKTPADASATTEVLLTLSARSREEADMLADRALASGGSPAREAEDHGFMYGRSFTDPDGHVWEVVWMDPTQIQE
ncbi:MULTISPECIES: VOC family protein [unclassified Streptomyces]|uniref:VOC family protein n=1 Tax=unclassified Streptomyces TaxID=2593676 RepID=UPI000BACA15C|nr:MULTISPECIES: VOC family protein [unclassified Streptomyces]ASY32554.1 glyoxalase [Streptomyces sp. CLI2509]MYX24255.1 glyoxalase [Streptomyces sp. SID8380]